MLIVFRTVFALGYIYVIGMGAYICFFGLPDFDPRSVDTRRLDETVIQAQATSCRIQANLSDDVLASSALPGAEACIGN